MISFKGNNVIRQLPFIQSRAVTNNPTVTVLALRQEIDKRLFVVICIDFFNASHYTMKMGKYGILSEAEHNHLL